MHAARNFAIDTRYSGLAVSSCCLSCGGALAIADPKPSEVCLDLGSGRGTDVFKAAEAVGSGGFAYGCDLSEGMLRKARRDAEKLGLSNVRFLECDFTQIALEDGTVDVITSNCALNHASDKRGVWAEIGRVLKPGGRFAVSDIYALEPVPPEHADDPVAVSECWGGAITKDEYLAAIAQGGLEDVKIVEESAPYNKGAIQVVSFTITGRRPVSRKKKEGDCR